MPQKELLLNAGLSFVEYDGLKIVPIAIPKLSIEEHIIITSKNAFRSIKSSPYWNTLKEKNWWVVGERTTTELQKHNLKINAVGIDSSDLAHKIINSHSNASFMYFTGNMRREELPKLLTDNNINYKEYIVYKTALTPKKFDTSFDGVLFFSPSGVESYTLKNKLINEMCFCIGRTTASEIKKYTENIVIANKASVENVIVQAAKYFKKYD